MRECRVDRASVQVSSGFGLIWFGEDYDVVQAQMKQQEKARSRQERVNPEQCSKDMDQRQDRGNPSTGLSPLGATQSLATLQISRQPLLSDRVGHFMGTGKE
jgi:hypothetical protein